MYELWMQHDDELLKKAAEEENLYMTEFDDLNAPCPKLIVIEEK
jgi:hypothetical protein